MQGVTYQGVVLGVPALDSAGAFEVDPSVIARVQVAGNRLVRPGSRVEVAFVASASTSQPRTVVLPERQTGQFVSTSAQDEALVWLDEAEYVVTVHEPPAAPRRRAVSAGGVAPPQFIVVEPGGERVEAGSRSTRPHSVGEPLVVSWSEAPFAFSSVVVYRAHHRFLDAPMIVHAAPRLETPLGILELELNGPTTTAMVPGSAFSEAGAYAVVVSSFALSSETQPSERDGAISWRLFAGSGAPFYFDVR